MPRKPDLETRLRLKEAAFPRLAKAAAKKAFDRAVNAGQKVLVAENGVLYEVTKDSKRAVKKLRQHVAVKPGKVIRIP